MWREVVSAPNGDVPSVVQTRTDVAHQWGDPGSTVEGVAVFVLGITAHRH